MSIQSKQNEVVRITKEIANLRKQDADEAKKESAKARIVDQTRRSLRATKSNSMIRSYEQKLVYLDGEIAKVRDKRAGIAKKIADKTEQLYRAEQGLSKEQDQERKKLIDADKKREREQLDYQRQVSRELERQRTVSQSASLISLPNMSAKSHDAFISHASEDKEEFVRPLAQALRGQGYDIWYDEFTLSVGDSLRRSIDRGLSASRYGIVILSSAFFAKNWTQYELDGLVAKEMEGEKVVLPIWHKVSKDEVMSYSSSLADKVAINSSLSSITEIVDQLSEVLKQRH
jgi:hypothetical protein